MYLQYSHAKNLHVNYSYDNSSTFFTPTIIMHNFKKKMFYHKNPRSTYKIIPITVLL